MRLGVVNCVLNDSLGVFLESFLAWQSVAVWVTAIGDEDDVWVGSFGELLDEGDSEADVFDYEQKVTSCIFVEIYDDLFGILLFHMPTSDEEPIFSF
jgi:hypothetical protein